MTEEQNPQPYEGDDAGPAGPYEDEVTTGGELNHTEEPAPVNPEESSDDEDDSEDDGVDQPVEATPVEVSPVAAPVSPEAVAASNTGTDTVHGKSYNVTPESGYRQS